MSASTRTSRLFRAADCLGLLAWGSAAAAEPQPEKPITIGVAYTVDALGSVRGGLRRDAALLGKVDLTAEADGGHIGWQGAAFYANLQYVHGPAFSGSIVGDAQVVSNIEAQSALQPFEVWVELPVARDAHLRLGLIDLNSVFDVQSVGAHFLNSSHGIGPEFSQSGLNGPSIFPVTAGAAVLRAENGPWSARFGLFDAVAGDPDRPKRIRVGFPGDRGLLGVGEIERALDDHAAIKVGVWTYSTRFDALDEFAPDGSPRRLRGSKGGYATLEGRLAENGRGELHSWLRIGVANDRVNLISTAIGGGATWGNDEARIGFAVSHARLGEAGRRAMAAHGAASARAETNIELSYAMSATEWLTIQPDIQYVINPGWRRDVDHALVVGVRTVIEFELR